MIQAYERSLHHLGRLGRRALLVCCAGLGGLTLSFPAMAGTQFTLGNAAPVANALPGGGWVVSPNIGGGLPSTSREFGQLLGGTFKVFDPLEIPGRAGPLPVRVQQAVKLADAAGVVARCLKAPVVCAAIGAGVAAGSYYFYKKYRVTPDGNGGLSADPGQAQQSYPGYKCLNPSDDTVFKMAPTAQAACQLLVGKSYIQNNSDGTSTQTSYTVDSCTQYRCDGTRTQVYWWTVSGVPAGSSTVPASWQVRPVAITMCPPVVNFYDPAYSVAGGPTGADGLCPSGSSQPVTEDQAAQKVVAFPPAEGDAVLPAAVKEAIEHGQTVPSTITTTGPQTQTGQPTSTTTTTSGGTSTQTQAPTYNYHYDGDTITYDTTVNNTTINNDGSTSTSSTTTTGPSPDKETKDPCDLHPDRVGCMGMGSPPDDQVQKATKSLSWSSEDTGLPASCPADVVVYTHQGPMTFTYKPACDIAGKVAPLVKAVGAFVALMMVAATLRSA